MEHHSLSTINTIITLHYQTHNSPFHASTCKSNVSTFNFLLEAIFKDLHRDEIAAKFMKAGTQDPISHANRFQDLGPLLTYRLPSHALVTQVSLFCNALTFDVRLNKAIPQPSRGVDPDHPFPCRLCGQADDEYRHIYGSCQVVELARKTFAKLINIPISAASLGFKDSLHLSLLAGGIGLNARNVNAIVVFNMAVWLTRTKKYVPAAIIPDPKEAANSIAREAASLASSLYSSRNSSSSKYGNAKNRSHEQELAAVQMIQDTLDTINPSSCVFYTDGSARPNPGACGAGVTLEMPKNFHLKLKRLDFHAALGLGTNNLGEIWAIGMAIQTLQILTDKHLIASTNAHIFSDSEFAMGALTNSTKVNKNNITNYKAITSIKKMIRMFPRDYINFHWVPGHAAVEGNERADALAERGSSRSAAGFYLTHILSRASHSLFRPEDDLAKLHQLRPPPWPGDYT
jgi:ribonuclease HI